MNNSVNGEQKWSRKEIRQLLYTKLSDAVGDFKGHIKQKKFENNIQWLTKSFAQDIFKEAKQKLKKSKKKAKKTVAVSETAVDNNS